MDCVPPGGGSSTAPKGTREGPDSLFTDDRREPFTQEPVVGAPDRGAQLAIATNGAMWCITRQPTLEGGTRATGDARELTRRGSSRRGRGGGGGDDWGQSDPDHIASDVTHIRAPHAACCVRRPSAGRTKGGGGDGWDFSDPDHIASEDRRNTFWLYCLYGFINRNVSTKIF